MKQRFARLVFVAIALSFCTPVYGGARHIVVTRPMPAPTPVFKPKADTIQSVSADSIIVTHTRIKMPAKPNRVGSGAKETSSTKTYRITPSTEIEINGARSQAAVLKTGMVVEVVSGGSSGLGADTEVASRIMAHDPPHSK